MTMIIAALSIILAGLIALEGAIKNAAIGYEDDFGFHEGLDPQRAIDIGARYPSAIAGHMVQTIVAENRPRRVSKRAPRKPVETGSVAPFPY